MHNVNGTEQRILVPVEGSDRSMEGLRYALEHFPDADFTVLHAVSTGSGDLGALSGTGGELLEQGLDEEAAESVLEAAREVASEHDIEVEPEQIRGRPDRAIVKYVEDNEYDLVVLGSRGRDGVARVLLGSVAEKIVRRLPILVLVVR
jgi:nucleotide-binding universal stress UspA family protein